MRRPVLLPLLAVLVVGTNAHAEPMTEPIGPAPPLGLSASANVGFGAPAGIVSVMARLDVYRKIFIEGDIGYGIAGREIGGGLGVTLMNERAKTAKLGWANTRLTASALVTQSRTTYREAGLAGLPFADLVRGAGTYTWGYLLTGGDIKLDSHLYILAEIGLLFRIGRDADYPMDPGPQDRVTLSTRAGFGATF